MGRFWAFIHASSNGSWCLALTGANRHVAEPGKITHAPAAGEGTLYVLMEAHGTTTGEKGALGLVLAHRHRNELATHEGAELGTYAGKESKESSIWSTSHHLQAAAEASAEISVAIKVQNI